MKAITFLVSLVVLQPVFSQHFSLPSGITYRAYATHYDCGEFGEVKAEAPEVLSLLNTKFTFLAADKRINDFLIELNTTHEDEVVCHYGVYLKRNRDDRTLYFESSVVEATSEDYNCDGIKSDLDGLLQALPYEGSRRGLRYLATTLNSLDSATCVDASTRIVFDRRYTPIK
ncbi:hypothetical protein [Halobacteriovorax sp.]|uniref:hypothetical protein n=1 Tax=Halobacteriovorax sp. TaxID=2020862 RepID=UPI0035654B6B